MAPPLTSEQEKILKKVYYTDHFTFGRDKIFKLVQHTGISRRQVWDWLAKQELHQIYQQPRKTKTIQPTVLKAPLLQIGIDLIDMSTQAYNGYTWILTAIDLFSKKAWAEPLKNKEGQTVADGMQLIINSIDDTPDSIRSDNGSEFISQPFKDLLANAGIKQVFSLAGKPQSNGGVERFNGILKRLINMSRTQGNADWPSLLPKLLASYNNSYQRVIKENPNEVAEATNHTGTHDLIEKNANKMKHLEPPPLNEGQQVRIKLTGSGALKFSTDVYTINRVTQPKNAFTPITYSLTNTNKEPISDVFYRNDLLLVPPGTVALPDQEEKYIVSKIVRPQVITGVQGYFVRWKGYLKASDITFQSREVLIADVPKMVNAYEKAHKVKWFKDKVTYTP